MDFSLKQNEAIQEVGEWLEEGESQVFRLFGYAGTGKTTIAQQIAANVNGLVHYAAFTGKAADVLSKKGCEGASTIHQLIYKPRPKGVTHLKELELQLHTLRKELSEMGHSREEIDGHRRVVQIQNLVAIEKASVSKPSFVLNPASTITDAKLVIIDECSMIDSTIGEDLLSFGVKILVLGDPAQLPPIKGTGYFTEHKPNVMLTEIHRQKSGNAIIPLATKVRKGERLSIGEHGSSRIINKLQVSQDDILAADQVLVGKNSTRYSYNKRIRQLKGYESVYPEIGEKLICLRNDHEVGLLNGSMWEVSDVVDINEDSNKITLSLISETGTEITVEVHTHYFTNTELPYWEKKEAQEFDFGYAITCHKSQGSQWDSIVIFDESGCFRENKNKWLYTAITRAAKKVIIVQM